MKAIKNIKKQKYGILNTTLMIIAMAVTLFSIVTGSFVHENENVSVGMVSPKKYVAQRDIEDVAATEKLKDAATTSVGPLYKHDAEVQSGTVDGVKELFGGIDNLIYDVRENDANYNTASKDMVLKIPVVLSAKHFQSYSELSEQGKEQFKNDVLDITEYVYDQGVTEDSKEAALEIVNDKLLTTQWNETLRNAAFQIISAAITPNLILDEEAMQAAIEQKVAEVKPVMIYKNQKIVDEGEIVTQDILNRLEALNLVNQDYADSVMPVIGSLIVVSLLFLAVYFYFATQDRKLSVKTNEMFVLFMCYIITVLILRITADLNVYYFIPIYLFAMLVSLLVSTKVALIFNMFICIVGMFVFNGKADFLTYTLVTGSFGALMMQYTDKRKRIIVVALVVGAVNFVTMVSMGLFSESGELAQLIVSGVYCAVTGILSVILVVGSMPLWEAFFEINTPFRLIDLANPNSEILRRLMIEAPGTYHHSLIVANLAEAAAYEVEANTSMVRVGAYYHDIGKLSYPLYFSENQGGENVHDSMVPSNSARIIIQHVTLGCELADKHRLPKIIKDIIMQHHGTTMVKYFYYKALKNYGKENINDEDFRYPGPIPETKEAAIIMLADTIEAAVRSSISGGKDMEKVEEIIDSLIKDKIDDGQFNNCNLTFKDISKIKMAFLRVFKGMYHDRIAYPKEAMGLSEKTPEIEQKTEGENK